MNQGKAYLVLEDGTKFEGCPAGAPGVIVGELVLYEGSDYMSVTADPSSTGQIVVFMQPEVGSWGVNTELCESGQCCLRGIAASQICAQPTHWRSAENMDYFLRRNFVPGVTGIDIGAVKKRVKRSGARRAAIVNSSGFIGWDALNSQINSYKYDNLLTSAVKIPEHYGSKYSKRHIGICDFGASKSLARMLVRMGAQVTLLPPYDMATIIERGNFTGMIVSNGSGKPKYHPGIVEALQNVVELGLPVLGVGSGSGFVAMACGAKLSELKTPHFGTRFPVIDKRTGRVYITRQTHSFDIDTSGLDFLDIVFEAAHDKTVEGFLHREKPVIGVNFLPAGDPRIGGTGEILSEFFEMMNRGEPQ